ncbi:dyp-type peroxidase [Xylaria multiplex]|uniref:Dyp-type peroxidase n=1 Tax=Xylaria multiplex TaxID=323545 RepID=A0A7C8MNM0_9PEZI|nr:dyp-type peroxidase [Xylaria multiplex]
MATPRPLDINNVQGDILEGLGKKNELFLFFRVKAGQASSFRESLRSFIPLITTTGEAKKFHQTIHEGKKAAARQGKPFPMIENSGVNISFSQKGLVALGITDDIGDVVFNKGMLANAEEELGDDLSDWDADFKKEIHGVIMITANSKIVLERTLDHVKRIFHAGHKDATIEEVTRLVGQTRPGDQNGHEHFGFNDGLSQPAVKDVDAGVTSEPNEAPVRQGVILLGREGDNGFVPPGGSAQGVTRPAWALDGSFLAFRYLKQLVPEFDNFLEANPLKGVPGIPAPGDPTGAELLGARLMGRWKSGAPIDLTPLRDNPAFATRQDFRFDPQNQERCPFAAHVRKTNPRSDLDAFGGTEVRRIIRRGIAFGPEVTAEEKKAKRSSNDEKLERGLLFACYQSNLQNGFHFMQQSWANASNFPPKGNATPPVPFPGIDPIIGVGNPRQMVGASPDIGASNQVLNFDAKWVIPRGGEYFFSPSIPALRETFAAHPHPSHHGHHDL